MVLLARYGYYISRMATRSATIRMTAVLFIGLHLSQT